MDFGVGFRVYADSTGFKKGIAEANDAANGLKHALKEVGISLRGAGLGTLLAGIIAGLRSAVNIAQEMVSEQRKLGQEIDAGALALVRFGDTMAKVKQIGFSVFSTIAQGMEQVGIYVGALVYGWDNAADAARKMGEEAEAAAKKMDSEKLIAAEKELNKVRADNTYKRSTDEERIGILLSRQVELLKEQNAVGKDTAAGVTLQAEIEKNRAQIADVSANIEKERAKAGVDLAKAMDEAVTLAEQERLTREQTLTTQGEQLNAEFYRTEELKKQTAALEDQERRLSKMLALSSMLNAAGGSVFNDASPEALRERLRRDQQRLIDQQNNPVGKDGSVGQMIIGADIGRLQIEIQNIKAELAFREKINRDYELGGEALARRNFRGDPIEFDRVFQQIVQDNRDSKQVQAETLEQLREMNQRQRNGMPVVNLNSK